MILKHKKSKSSPFCPSSIPSCPYKSPPRLLALKVTSPIKAIEEMSIKTGEYSVLRNSALRESHRPCAVLTQNLKPRSYSQTNKRHESSFGSSTEDSVELKPFVHVRKYSSNEGKKNTPQSKGYWMNFKEKQYKPLFFKRNPKHPKSLKHPTLKVFYELKIQEGRGSLPVMKNASGGWESGRTSYWEVPALSDRDIPSPF
ncbi:unnamed protein product [Blepharisma stoltei]|uniref:Uncharacterized protein n=1 Tax=Blepharisma stoltei TaxID=1481888 RepID=A0AAU9K8T4_9CILI|nr:unnamed protein product [Blepharisma stoltei]